MDFFFINDDLQYIAVIFKVRTFKTQFVLHVLCTFRALHVFKYNIISIIT